MKTIRKAKNLFVAILFACMFLMAIAIQGSNALNVNANEINNPTVGNVDNTLRVVVEKSDGSGEITLFYLKEMIGLYGVNGKVTVVPEDYENENCTELGTVREMLQEYGASGKIVLKGKNINTEIATIGDFGGCETNKIVIVEDDDDDPDVVGICTIGQLIELS